MVDKRVSSLVLRNIIVNKNVSNPILKNQTSHLNTNVKGGFMKQNTKKFLALGVLGMFMFIFAMQLVMAADTPLNPIRDWFAEWEEGTNFSANIAKYLFWALVSMAVFSIGSKIPIFSGLFDSGKVWLGALFSITVGFLSMAYITPDEVYAMMTSYSALGFVIGGVIPFIVLITFTFTLATEGIEGSKQRLTNQVVAWIMWLAFVGFMVYKIIVTPEDPSAAAGISLLHWAALAVGVGMLIFLGAIFKRFGKMATKAEIDEYTTMSKKQVGKLKADVKALKNATIHEL